MAGRKLNALNFQDNLKPNLVAKKLGLMTHTISTGEPSTLGYPLVIDDKEYYFIERLTALDEQQVLAFVIDITSGREAERQLEWQAYHDDLTGLANRVMFFEFLGKLVQDHRRNRREFTVLFIDLNGFKTINDQHGHHAGDNILKHIARQLKTVLRQTDTIDRVGGDEFAVLLPKPLPNKLSVSFEPLWKRSSIH